MRQKKWLFATSMLAFVMLGCAQSLTTQTQQEPAKAAESGQAPSSQPPKVSEVPAPADQQKPKKLNPFTGNADAIKEGRQLYLQSGCPGCHGSGGGGAMAGLRRSYVIPGSLVVMTTPTLRSSRGPTPDRPCLGSSEPL